MLLAIELALIIEKLVLILIVVMSSLVIAMYTTFAERKGAAVLQDRRGPNRAGPFGLLQPLADGMKLFFKEEIIPNFSIINARSIANNIMPIYNFFISLSPMMHRGLP